MARKPAPGAMIKSQRAQEERRVRLVELSYVYLDYTYYIIILEDAYGC